VERSDPADDGQEHKEPTEDDDGPPQPPAPKSAGRRRFARRWRSSGLLGLVLDPVVPA